MAGPTDRGKLRLIARQMLAIGQWIAQREELPQTDSESRPPRPAPNGMDWLNHKEPLPTIPPQIQANGRFLSWLVAPERLPIETPGREQRAESFFRWLLTSKKLTVNEVPKAIKEASSHES